MTKEEVIKQEIGIEIGADKLTPMDYGECKRCMDIHAKQKAWEVWEKITTDWDDYEGLTHNPKLSNKHFLNWWEENQ